MYELFRAIDEKDIEKIKILISNKPEIVKEWNKDAFLPLKYTLIKTIDNPTDKILIDIIFLLIDNKAEISIDDYLYANKINNKKISDIINFQ